MSTTGLVLWALCIHVYSRTTTLSGWREPEAPKGGGVSIWNFVRYRTQTDLANDSNISGALSH